MILCGRLRETAPAAFSERYKLTDADDWNSLDLYDLFELIGKKRGFLISGGEINTERTADMLIDEFRAAKLGRVTLDRI